MSKLKTFLSLCIFLVSTSLFAQKDKSNVSVKGTKVEVVSLDELSFKKIDGKPVRILLGNVVFKKDNVIFKCDSAIQFIEDETIFAYKNVRFNQGDTLRLTGDELFYSEKTDMVEVKGEQVVMTDGKMNLRTTALYYNMATEIAYYLDSAYITDADNILHSKKGYYYAKSKDMFFKTRVRLTNPDYSIKTDTLGYNVNSENSSFKGPSYINTKDGQYLYCENGVFYSEGNEVRLGKNSFLRDGGQILTGDSLYFNSKTGMGYAYKRAKLIDTLKHLNVEGNYAVFNRKTESYMITDSMKMVQYEGGDTLYLSSDTLKLFYDSTKTKRIALAYNNVRIFSRNYQAACDSMAYHQSDSIIDYFGSPLFWMDSFQISATDIRGYMGKDGIEKVRLTTNALMGQKHPYEQYDQMGGDSMTAHFKKGKIKRVEIHSSAKAIYYVLEGDTALVGANNVSANRGIIRFNKDGIRSLAFIEKGESIVTPAKAITPSQLKLNGFVWKGYLRPYKVEEIFTRKAAPITATTQTPLQEEELEPK